MMRRCVILSVIEKSQSRRHRPYLYVDADIAAEGAIGESLDGPKQAPGLNHQRLRPSRLQDLRANQREHPFICWSPTGSGKLDPPRRGIGVDDAKELELNYPSRTVIGCGAWVFQFRLAR